MKTANTIWIGAPAAPIYRLAAEVERWPEILPHYRAVTVLERRGPVKLVAMAATRDGFPVSWQALQTLDEQRPLIEFRHVRGITTGMEVVWRFVPEGQGTRVTIEHELALRWPLIGAWAADQVVGPLFVENIAAKTLRCIKRLAELENWERQTVAQRPEWTERVGDTAGGRTTGAHPMAQRRGWTERVGGDGHLAVERDR